MNQDIIAGNWKQLKGKIQAKWGDLTDDDFKVAEGNAEYLTGKLQERYGYDRDRANTEVQEFQRTLRSDSTFKH
ncbi:MULTISPECIES: CsbD family protein [Pseudoxanthomonas]|jgi:uncharacterized protein YjbJ (UPF0337 family)|uniref:CsbD-like domain-containing protein n=1 Tax=Pseudoxanthomonas japonensis TaxID=69284 RepID=A0ABQ6ZJH4_9GAMM|nr:MULTISPECIES: CsbD family protein [Pseudoxanthomonas]KAF1726264.1 hypothetical protein CSC78_06325 [Pseudoxanthomonas japonensis]MCR6626335.1 CsbD family protein [Pseudoxanthomonas sp.]NCT70802.1 CsbD family protein [Xanthomonadaceae bacterium]PZQ27774.1 MAG: CsbD family protein [Stenotrophomonas acidaminiphila]